MLIDVAPTLLDISGLPPELYDLKHDPDQMENRADILRHAGIIAKLEIELQKELKSIGLNEELLPKAPRTTKE